MLTLVLLTSIQIKSLPYVQSYIFICICCSSHAVTLFPFIIYIYIFRIMIRWSVFILQELLRSMVLRTDVTAFGLDFTGIQQLTDDTFLVLKKVLSKARVRPPILNVFCVGCVHLTDFGISCLAQALPLLKEVSVLWATSIFDQLMKFYIHKRILCYLQLELFLYANLLKN